MSVEDLKNLLAIAAAVLALPVAAFGLWLLLRHWRARARKEQLDALGQEQERAYLAAVLAHMEDLNRPLGYQQGEFTTPQGRLRDEAQVQLRYVFRRAERHDRLGLGSADVAHGESTRGVRDVAGLLRQASRPIVLLGEPGSGKSVTLRHLAQSLAQKPLYVGSMLVLPVYLHLGRYRQTAKGGQLPARFGDYLRDELKACVPRGDVVLKLMDEALSQGRLYLVLDGMDEMPTRHHAERVQEIQRFMVEHGRNRFVVACRRREYTGSLPHGELVIEPFDPQRVRDYLERHWALYAPATLRTGNDPADLHERLLALAEPEHPLHVFASSPFALKLIANHFFASGGALPTSQAEVFDGYVRRRLAVELQRRQLGADRADEILQAWQKLAFDALSQSLGTYVLPPTAPGAAGRPAAGEALPVGVASGLMRQEPDGAVRFEHHRLLEYLAACHWERESPGDLAVTPEQLANPWWRETLSLRAGITRAPDQLIMAVVRAIDRRYLAVLELRFGEEEQPARKLDEVQDDQALRLSGIVALEVALACARQRPAAFTEEVYQWMQALLKAIPERGSLIEKVRLVRALHGLPLALTLPVLQALAQEDSPWMDLEVFKLLATLPPGDPEAGCVMRMLLKAKSSRFLLDRLLSERGLGLRLVLRHRRQAPRGAGFTLALAALARAAPLLLGLAVGAWIGMVGVLALLKMPAAQAWPMFLAAGAALAALGCYFSGWRLTLITCTLCLPAPLLTNMAYASLVWVLLWHHQFCVTAPFKAAAAALPSALQRYLQVWRALSRSDRMVTWALVGVLVALHLARLLPAPRPSGIVVTLCGAGMGLLVERLAAWREAHTTRALMAALPRDGGPQALRRHLARCLQVLSRPLDSAQVLRLLEHVGSLPLDEAELLEAVRAMLTEPRYALLPREATLQVLDRVDLRRRQRAQH